MSWAEPRVLRRDGIDILTLQAPDVVPGIDAATTVIDHVSAWQLTVTWSNPTGRAAVLGGLDALTAALPDQRWSAMWFTSRWGKEFTPERREDAAGLVIETRTGRSSHGAHPLIALSGADRVILISVAWSGNWRIAIDDDGIVRAGISPHEFWLELGPGESVTSPAVFVATGATLADAGANLAAAVGRLVPRTPWSESMPTEWNHWWPYEDRDITQEIFAQEAEQAAELGLSVATLDAGWFGSADANADWQAERGDWHLVNTDRFPDGLATLADRVRAQGAEFGIWIEGEAVGADAALRHHRPELLAARSRLESIERITVSLDPDDPTFLGYLCLGSPAARAFVEDALDRVVTETGARWLKLDFNVDPGSGCDRTDHGHGAGDGLFRHYEGLYAVLDAFRERHPEVVLEACASGGLRLDLGLAQHVHCSFLSDTDWTEHHLQVLWAASMMFPPAAMLHWSWSQWRGDHAPQQRDLARLEAAAFDRELRAAMLHRFGVSLRLGDLSEQLRERLRLHVAVYRREIAPLLPAGVLRARTGQPLRAGLGERHPVFQLDDGEAHLLAAFSLDSVRDDFVVSWDRLDPEARYRVEELGSDAAPWWSSGADLMEDRVRTGGSWLALARRDDGRCDA